MKLSMDEWLRYIDVDMITYSSFDPGAGLVNLIYIVKKMPQVTGLSWG